MTAIKDLALGSNAAYSAIGGVISYEGYYFGAFRHIKVKMDPVYDRSGKTIIATDITFDVHGVVHGSFGGSSTEAMAKQRMLSLETALSKPRGRLFVQDIGLFDTIDSRNTPDLNWGPKPQVIFIEPLGGNKSWEVAWSVVYRSPVLGTSLGAVTKGAILECSWTTELSVVEGLTTRTCSGFIGFLNYKGAAAKCEAAFDRLKFPRPDWFRRAGIRRAFNAARNGVDFIVVDEEQSDDAYPDGILKAEAEESIENVPPGFVNWSGSLSASFETPVGVPKSLALDKWTIMLFDAAKRFGEVAAASGGVMIPERLKMTAPRFGRRSRFFASWRMSACLHDVVAKSGMWSIVPGTSFARWSQSMATVFSPRGVSQMRDNDADIIIDLGSPAPSSIPVGQLTGYRPEVSGNPTQALLCPQVTREKSYVAFRNRIRGEQGQSTLIHSAMQAASAVVATVNPFPVPETGLTEDVVHYQGKSENYIVMQGYALRLKFDPEVPKLESVQGVAVEEMARSVTTETITGYFDCPLIETRWAILYLVKDQIYGVRPANNRKLCFLGGQKDGIQ